MFLTTKYSWSQNVTRNISDCTGKFDKKYGGYVYKSVTKQASFPEGASGWQRFIHKNFRYPQTKIENETQAVTVATFIVDKEGNLSNFGIKGKPKRDWTAFDKEFIKTISKSGRWVPAKCNERTVTAYHEQYIEVLLEN